MLDNHKRSETPKYKSPKQKLVKFFQKSRDNWKKKYVEMQYKAKLLSNQVRYLQKSKEELSSRIKELEKQLSQSKKK